jgi:hypothetical protein
MSNFYGSDPNSAGGGGGFYNQSSSGGNGEQQFQQPTQQPQQQPAYQYANVNQWQQQPSSQNNNTQQQQAVQQPQQQATPAFWNPSAAAAVAGFAAQAASGGFSNEAVLDSMLKGGAKAWQSGGASMIPGFDTTMQALRTYFAVDNRYVKRKMQKVLFPFLSKQWRRVVSDLLFSCYGVRTILYFMTCF